MFFFRLKRLMERKFSLETHIREETFFRRLKENTEFLEELNDIAEREGISAKVEFITSCSTARRNQLLSECLCVLYTPKDEHFGIVPLEAMVVHKPVIACNGGGPVETIRNGITGFLRDPTQEEFASAMAKLIVDPRKAEAMGEDARKHAESSFSTQMPELVHPGCSSEEDRLS